MSLPSHFYFNDPLVTFMFGGLSYSACVFAVCVCVRVTWTVLLGWVCVSARICSEWRNRSTGCRVSPNAQSANEPAEKRSWVSSKYRPLENNASQFTDVCQNGALQLAVAFARFAGYATWVAQDAAEIGADQLVFALNCSQSISNWIRSHGPPMGTKQFFGDRMRSHCQHLL